MGRPHRAALQAFDADGRPIGKPAVGKARPGTAPLEHWTVAPQVQSEWTVTLKGPTALPMAALRDARSALRKSIPRRWRGLFNSAFRIKGVRSPFTTRLLTPLPALQDFPRPRAGEG